MASTLLITVPLFFLFTIPACAVPQHAGDNAYATKAEEITPADADSTEEEAAKTEAPGAATATGLDIVMDGSSLKAFDKSMEEVKTTGSEFDYRSLESAIDFLLVYDLGEKRSREKLAARLDGMTGHEIIERVKKHKRK